jgi:hypothetical protein
MPCGSSRTPRRRCDGPAPVESPVTPAMTGKALFRRLAAERRHGDVPGNGEGGIAASNFDPLERRVRTVALAPSELRPEVRPARPRAIGRPTGRSPA